MRRVGLYFGSFNPVTIAHLLVANAVYNTGLVDEIWLVVTPENPFKSNSSELVSFEHRVEMSLLATRDCGFLKVCDVEGQLPRPNYTINTLLKLTEENPECDFYIVCGEDVYFQSKNWKSAEQIKSNYKFIVHPRPGYEKGVIVTPYEGSVYVLSDVPALPISSTIIREMIKNNKSINFLVNNYVKEYINTNKLYI